MSHARTPWLEDDESSLSIGPLTGGTHTANAATVSDKHSGFQLCGRELAAWLIADNTYLYPKYSCIRLSNNSCASSNADCTATLDLST